MILYSLEHELYLDGRFWAFPVSVKRTNQPIDLLFGETQQRLLLEDRVELERNKLRRSLRPAIEARQQTAITSEECKGRNPSIC